jgi:hypothetical protein
MQSGGTKQCFLQHISLEIFLPLDFQSWQSCYTANFYWIIKGNEFDAVGLYMSFQNGDWTINDWTISEFWCNSKCAPADLMKVLEVSAEVGCGGMKENGQGF